MSNNFYKECAEICPYINDSLQKQEKMKQEYTQLLVLDKKLINYGQGFSEEGNPTKFIDGFQPPENFGMENSEQIIPKYYFYGKDLTGKLLECNYYYTIIDSIRNMRILNNYQIQYIEKLDKEDCYELLREYNKMMKNVIDYILLDEDFSEGFSEP